ncbi:hypothetical protein HAZT_HAZT010619, partial [Hyalella azteca]
MVPNSLVEDLEMTCFVYDKYGKTFMKAKGVSPDSFIQMAIQLAFYRRVPYRWPSSWPSTGESRKLHTDGHPAGLLQVSPDSFIQMAIQLAFYRVHGEPAAHYESASTRMFAGGRTETIRSCSEESAAFCAAALDASAAPRHQRRLLLQAVAAHNAYAKQVLGSVGQA